MWAELLGRTNAQMVTPDQALPGRSKAIQPEPLHAVNGHQMVPPFPEQCRELVVGMGCFWGAERLFWQIPGVHVTAVGYAGGYTPNPTYEEVCSGRTGHTEAVRVIYDPAEVTLGQLLQCFWESHDPTQGMRQGNDRGTQYRSALYLPDEDTLAQAKESAERFQQALNQAGQGEITTEIATGQTFYYAETYHQQYLAKNPGGYCGLAGTGVTCPA